MYLGDKMERYKLRSRWVKMLSRCEDKDYPLYKDYGGRGIKVCKEWHDFNKFYEWCINNGIQSNLQIDRIDNDGDYKPSNCRIVTRSENANNKRNNTYVVAFGEKKTLSQWVKDKRCVVKKGTLQRRLRLGWDPEEALTAKPLSGRHYKPKKDSKFYTAFGEKKTLFQWSKDDRCKVSYKMLWQRVEIHGWDIKKAVTKPPKSLSK
jgi:hypothetical protein